MQRKLYQLSNQMFMEDGMGELSKLPNIGKTVEEQHIQVGINTPEE